MEAFYRFVSGAVAGAVSFFAPLAPSVFCALAFVAADFVTGVAADRRRTLGCGRRWAFTSAKAWRTVLKAGFLVTAIAMCRLLEVCVLDFVTPGITKLFTGFACGVELWSFLENASVVSQAPLFVWLKRYVGLRLGEEAADE